MRRRLAPTRERPVQQVRQPPVQLRRALGLPRRVDPRQAQAQHLGERGVVAGPVVHAAERRQPVLGRRPGAHQRRERRRRAGLVVEPVARESGQAHQQLGALGRQLTRFVICPRGQLAVQRRLEVHDRLREAPLHLEAGHQLAV